MSYPEALSELTNYPKALSHVSGGSGGGANLKTLNIVNNLNAALFVNNCISGGYYGEIKVAAGETATVQYVALAESIGKTPVWIMATETTAGNFHVTASEGVNYVTDYEPNGLYIVNTAPDVATATFETGAA